LKLIKLWSLKRLKVLIFCKGDSERGKIAFFFVKTSKNLRDFSGVVLTLFAHFFRLKSPTQGDTIMTNSLSLFSKNTRNTGMQMWLFLIHVLNGRPGCGVNTPNKKKIPNSSGAAAPFSLSSFRNFPSEKANV